MLQLWCESVPTVHSLAILNVEPIIAVDLVLILSLRVVDLANYICLSDEEPIREVSK